jgi:hypothetical protein
LWNAADKAVVAICELLGLLFGLPFGDDLYHNEPVTGWHIFYLAVGLVFAGGGPVWPWIRTRPWFSKTVASRVSRVAADPIAWVGILLLLFLYKTGPELYQRATTPVIIHDAPTVTGFTQQQVDEKLAAANAKIQSDLNAANDKINALQAAINKGNAPPSPPPSYSDEEIGIRSDLWHSIQNDTNRIVEAYNFGDALLSQWQSQVGVNKDSYLQRVGGFRKDVTNASEAIEKLRRDYPKYQDISAAIDQTYLGPLLNSIDQFSSGISALPTPPPLNYETTIRPLAGAIRVQMQVWLNWISSVRSTAGAKLNQLAIMSGK